MNYSDSDFSRLVDEILEEHWKAFPLDATFSGIHKYDHTMGYVDIGSLTDFNLKILGWLDLIGKFQQADNLNSDNILDAEILISSLEYNRLSFEFFNRFKQDPSFYPGQAIMGCLIMLIRDFMPKEERLRLLTLRMKDLPRYFAEAKDNLCKAESIPALWLEMAEAMTVSGQQFLGGLSNDILCDVPSLKKEIDDAIKTAILCFDNYMEFLRGKLGNKKNGSFASGKEYFDLVLKRHHLLPYTSDDLEQIGLEFMDRTIREMNELAAQIAPNKPLEKIMEEIKEDGPSAEGLLAAYRNEINRTRKFIVEKEIVSIPESEFLDIMETPVSERSTLPYAAYMPAAPFESKQQGYFWVTPIDKTSPEKAAAQLTGHSWAAIEVRTLHEGYPGHHLQLCIANALKSKVRRIFGTNVFVEGWALYCEEMMKNMGYYTNPKTIFIQLKDQLWRACRVVIDARLHTGKFGFEDAVAMLVKTAYLERHNAEAEVRRYTQNPTQPMSYLIGKLEILRLTEDFRRKYPDIPLRDFHNKLLSFGSIPVSLVRKAMMGTN
jgi:hypothetical protein